MNRGAIYSHVLRDKDFKTPNLPLYHHEAEMRDRLLSNVQYDLVLNFSNQDAKNLTFLGRVKIIFMINKELGDDEKLFLDFHGNGIYEFGINGKNIPLNQINFSKHRI